MNGIFGNSHEAARSCGVLPRRPQWAAALPAIVVLALLWPADVAFAACDGPAANDVVATCTGTTNDQGPGGLTGYGNFGLTNLNVTVVPDATVTGTQYGINFATGAVFNFGVISGGFFGILSSHTATVTNSGTIWGGDSGVLATTNATVDNSGSIAGGSYGIQSSATANVTNSGSISGGDSGIFGITANVTNSGTVSGGLYGVWGHVLANVINSGTIAGTAAGIYSPTGAVVVTNTGAISGGVHGIWGLDTAHVINSGSITGGSYGIHATTGTATVRNSGSVSGGIAGIQGDTTVDVTNTGFISGGTYGVYGFISGHVSNSGTVSGGDYGIYFLNNAGNVTNSGTISGSIAALSFGNGADTLTLLPGSRIIGAINMGLGADAVNFTAGPDASWLVTLSNFAGTIAGSGGAPFVIDGNRIATLDPTGFAASGASLMDFSRGISSVVGDRTGDMAAAGLAGATAFAAEADAVAQAHDAFAAIPGLSAYAGDAMVFKNPTVQYADGSGVWARGFAGQRVQQGGIATLRTRNQFYGGMLGGEFQARPDLKLGGFIGAGSTRSTIDMNSGDSESDLVFAGLFGRYAFGTWFLSAALQGGHVSTDVTRNVFNNLAPGGIERATAGYEGWYINPEMTIGRNISLGSLAGADYTLTPSVQVRYLYGSFDGYTESGSSANLTVGERSMASFEERGQLKLTRTQVFAPADVLMTSIYGGLLGSQRTGENTVDATLLGQAIPFATPGDDQVWGGFGGMGFEWRVGRVGVFASAEYLALSDSSEIVSAQGGLRVAF